MNVTKNGNCHALLFLVNVNNGENSGLTITLLLVLTFLGSSLKLDLIGHSSDGCHVYYDHAYTVITELLLKLRNFRCTCTTCGDRKPKVKE